jgi:riboflavin kinase/FMN adenylyltransferase
MKIFRQLDDIQHTFTNACVTMGNFDGVHRGHQLLFNCVVQKARKCEGTSVAITFDPHPLQILRPGGIKLISTIEQKIELIEMAGIDVLIIVPFSREFAATTADSFVQDILVDIIGVTELVVGYDYAFGKGRAGDISFLREQGAQRGFPVTVVEAHYEDDILVSSTKIRELVSSGDVEHARHLLGRHYQIRGTVQVGKQRGGAELGFPTANLSLEKDDLVPRHGVYVCQVICAGKCYGGVVNIGYNPTFEEKKLVVETHIFDFNKDIYGKPIKLNLLQFIRDEKKFDSIDELTGQIAADALEARTVLADNQQELAITCEEKFNR